jgi:hypothetical protein
MAKPDDLAQRAATVSDYPEILGMREAHVPVDQIDHIRTAYQRCTRLYDEAVYDALRQVAAPYRQAYKTHAGL